MKTPRKNLLLALLALGSPLGLSSCLTDAYVGTGVYYGPHRDPWFNDDPWMDGHRWYGEPRGEANVGIYIHPPRFPRLPR